MGNPEMTRGEEFRANVSRSKSDSELIAGGATRLNDGRLEVSKEQNDRAYEEMETKIGLNLRDLGLINVALERLQTDPELTEQDQKELAAAISKIKTVFDKRIGEKTERDYPNQ